MTAQADARRALDETAWDAGQRRHHPSALEAQCSTSRRRPPARIIVIDDWSWRKSWRYGTIIVDLERRNVMDILEDGSVASVAQWLKRHPSIEVVSRDQCGLYAQAARLGAPQASQMADRFHLIQNLRLAIEGQMSLSGRATGRAMLPDEDIEIDHDD
ncbi:hypothetical protein CEJ86_30105 [Sinorhizobium meliloti]|uniref:Transposase IS204/IS1001/IS1096/IS1165 DDE domain-containing protein n=1 Tax=Rhizobium meliloti TaxID=382 RepID=A0A2J0YU28_RHIML|nr:hypothetical protein CEJ86_30105 [Sinorhizobium meliloti]